MKGRWDAPFAGYLFILPWLLGFLLLTLWPMLQSLYFSFTDYSLLTAPKWVGLKNFEAIFKDRFFYNSLKVTFLYVITSVPLRLIFALFVAMLLAKNIKFVAFYRTAVYLPSLLGASIAVALLWKHIFSRDGFVNDLLALVGVLPKNWVGLPETALGTLVLLGVWQFGSAMIIFLAGLKQIPKEMYEASSIDGAGKSRQFLSITLPMLSPVILFNLIMGMIGAFQMFTKAYVVTEGGPMNTTEVYGLYLYDKAFTDMEMGYASALAWILLGLIAVATIINFVASKYWVFYETEGGGSR
ncbi:carbohydrate ABC transporter permease [Paenibacillus agricola]|uniref:Sugar ABC transporter permease n=1 Tax=Paenibacillus agricola TaxID=2716264 RepID=A0ABX0JHV0_9BACL|nr:sugar ABC transporter permease [Paenibacillus agricola]NHN34909.1 sugar ABC transporter permease [Paenibacillus agricola]